MSTHYKEDKTCRICGFADISNHSLLDAKYRTLYEKISTVFPIVIYESDPLPKNICSKCNITVCTTYDTIQKVVRTQRQWINNVRTLQPDHNYVQVLDAITNYHTNTANNIYRITDGQLVLNNPFRSLKIATYPKILPKTPSTTRPLSSPPQMNQNQKSTPVVIPIPATIPILNSTEISIEPCRAPKKVIKSDSPKIEQLQTILESNGCSLLTVSTNKSKTPATATKNQPSTRFKCTHCPRIEFNRTNLAKHQLKHIDVPVQKLYERRILDKSRRRGRLIVVQNRKCIRCLNCWRIFIDNKSVLEHWILGNCEYFCQICGRDYAASPKMLREHVPAAHGITYRSSKRRELPPLVAIKTEPVEKIETVEVERIETVEVGIKSEPMDEAEVPPYIKQEIDADTPASCETKTSEIETNSQEVYADVVKRRLQEKVMCTVCHMVFDNLKARNSHMRLHTKSCDEVKEEPIDPSSPSTSQTHTVTVTTPVVCSTSKPTSVSQPLKVKPLVDLQDPSISSQLNEVDIIPEKPPPAAFVDQMNYNQSFICHPCGEKFPTKLELFRHKRKCQANNVFACEFCTKGFVTSADMQLHIMLMHKTVNVNFKK